MLVLTVAIFGNQKIVRPVKVGKSGKNFWEIVLCGNFFVREEAKIRYKVLRKMYDKKIDDTKEEK